MLQDAAAALLMGLQLGTHRHMLVFIAQAGDSKLSVEACCIQGRSQGLQALNSSK
jgi:hypothetical protein